MLAAIKFPLAEPEEVQNSKYSLYLPSKEVGMDLFYFPRQVAATARLLHLGNRVFLYALSGMHPHPEFNDFNREFQDENKRVISILIFQALPLPDTHIQEGFFPAKLLYSVHYNINTTFPNQGGILGCFPFGPAFVIGDGSHPTHAERGKAPVSDFPSDPLFVPQTVPDVLQPWTEGAMTLALQSKEAMTTQSLPPISVEAEGHKDVENIVVATTSVEAARVDTGVDDCCVDTEDDFIRTTGSRLVCKRKRIDQPHGPGWHPLGSDVETVRLTRPCDASEIIKLAQTHVASLKNALNLASQALIEERQSREHCLQALRREHDQTRPGVANDQ